MMKDRRTLTAILFVIIAAAFFYGVIGQSLIGDNIKVEARSVTILKGNVLSLNGGWEEGGFPVRESDLFWRLTDSNGQVKLSGKARTDSNGLFTVSFPTAELATGAYVLDISPDSTFTLTHLMIHVSVTVITADQIGQTTTTTTTKTTVAGTTTIIVTETGTTTLKEGGSGGAFVRFELGDQAWIWLNSPYMLILGLSAAVVVTLIVWRKKAGGAG